MKRITPALTLIVSVLLLSPRLHAQSGRSTAMATSHLTIGASLEAGLSHSFNVREKTSTESAETPVPIFAYRAGLAFSYPFSSTTSGMLTIGVDSRGGKFDTADSSSIFSHRGFIEGHKTDRISYVSITPALNLSMLYIGVNIGVPLGGTRSDQGHSVFPTLQIDQTSDTTFDFDAHQKDLLNIMIEPRIGAIIPLIDNQTGWLGVSIIAGYALTRVSKSEEIGGVTFEDPHQLATVQLGLTWQFTIPGTGGGE